MSNNLLAKNIKSLRKAYGETQLELAMAIGFDSPNTISNYEKGERRSPEPETIKKLAAHFRITEDELIHTDFSNMRFSPNLFDNKEKMYEMTLLMLPILTSEKALENKNFRKAYDAHMRTREAMKSGKEIDEADVDICIDSYSDAYEKDDIPEATANLLGWLMAVEIYIKNPWMEDLAEAIDNNSIKHSELLKSYYLRDMSEETADLGNSEPTQTEIDGIDEAIKEILKELKQDANFSSLADYYLALRYALGCVENERTEDMYRSIGYEMMWAFSELGNDYARCFIQKGIENNRK